MRIESNRKVHRTNRLSLGVLDMYARNGVHLGNDLVSKGHCNLGLKGSV